MEVPLWKSRLCRVIGCSQTHRTTHRTPRQDDHALQFAIAFRPPRVVTILTGSKRSPSLWRLAISYDLRSVARRYVTLHDFRPYKP
jgi:hypothetical protein